MENDYQTTGFTTTTSSDTWTTSIGAGGYISGGYSIGVDIGTQTTAPITPFQEVGLDYRNGRDRYSYAEDDNSINTIFY